MLELVARHGGFDLKIEAKGDLDVDQHHTVEDVGIALGEAVRRRSATAAASIAPATSSCRWTKRWRSPRSISAAASTRSSICLSCASVGDLQAELVSDFFDGFAQGARANVHLKVLYGRSSHHQVEAVFKAFARALRVACVEGSAHWRACCRAPRDCCDRAHRLRRRQPGPRCAKASRAAGAELFTPRGSAGASPTPAGIVVPGVGHFGATAALDGDVARTPSCARSRSAVPLLGICLGMQWLFEGSDEAPDVAGLGLLAGRCARLPPTAR